MSRVAIAVAILFATFLVTTGATAAPSETGATQANERVCGVPAEGRAACFAIHHPGKSGKPGPSAPPPVSYKAAEIQSAYGLTAAAAPVVTRNAAKRMAIAIATRLIGARTLSGIRLRRPKIRNVAT